MAGSALSTQHSALRSIYIAAVGGQGGNLFTEWLTAAATAQGQRAQSVSLTGLSQRGGATGYYVELAGGPGKNDVVFCQYPVPGELDVLVGQELLEMARAVEQGLTSSKTTIITSTHRMLSTPEKLPAGGGVEDPAELLAIGRRFSGRFIAFDAVALAREHGMDEILSNAILFGALAATDALGISPEACRQAIERTGIAVEPNLRAFDIGLSYVAERQYEQRPIPHEPTLDELAQERATRLSRRKRAQYLDLFEQTAEKWIEPVRQVLVEALYRLIDYQNVRYARTYLEMVEEMWHQEQVPQDPQLTLTYARNLATLMTYEDGARVAQLKIRQERFDRIKAERGLGDGQLYVLRDYLKPDAYEIYGLFPASLVDLLLPLGRKLFGRHERYLELTAKTNSFWGILTFWFLTLFIPFRPWSYRFRDEWRGIEEYRARVLRFLDVHYDLAVLMADTGQMIKGYGHTRRKTRAAMQRYVDNIVSPLVAADSEPYRLTLETAQALRKVIAADDPGIDQAEARVQDVLTRMTQQPREQVLAYVEAQPVSQLVSIQPATRAASH
ncbi:MAG TPA: indolepyruvate oxidoreductase subunit beta family protein [Chloroflexota bacterium]|nr:indolepyruvate oxidoreductase subunit beta family protein [Chloroflexota bacterium]